MFHVVCAVNEYGAATRFVIGCRDVADDLAADLCVHGFAVVIHSLHVPPSRSSEEMARAKQILATLQPMGAPQ